MFTRRFNQLKNIVRKKRIAVTVAAVVVFQLAATTAYAASFNTITVNLDGEVITHTTNTKQIKEVLVEEMGVELGSHDYLDVDLTGNVEQGMEIKWIPAVEVALVFDGERENKWTVEKTVGSFLLSEDIVLSDNDKINVAIDSAITSHMIIDIESAFLVTLKDAKDVSEFMTTSVTVGQLLADSGVTLGEFDEITASTDTLLIKETNVEITRIGKSERVEKEKIPFKTVREEDDTLLVGTEEVITEGVEGLRKKTIEVVTENGKVVSEEVTSKKVVKKKVDKVIAVGTKEPSESTPAVPASTNNTARNPVTESSNPSSNNSNTEPAPKTTKKPSANASDLVSFARSLIGSPYVSGGTSPAGFDCSGFVFYVFQNVEGKTLPRSSAAMYGGGSPVNKANLAVGDLVFYNTSGRGVSHVAIYIGGNQIIHSVKCFDKSRFSTAGRAYKSRYFMFFNVYIYVF